MKVLQLCLRLPWPPNDGGTIAMYNMTNALRNNSVDVKIVAFNTLKHFVEPDRIPAWYSAAFNPELVYLDATVRPVEAFCNLFSKDSYNISRFDTPEMHQCISDLLTRETFDIIQLESLFMTPYLDTIRKFSKAKVILRAHNVEFVIWERLAGSERNLFRKFYLNLLTKRLKKYECSIMNLVDGIIVLTKEDQIIFENSGCSIPVYVSPVSIDTNEYSSSNITADSKQVFHLGSMDWMPNVEGVDWFLDKVLPLIDQKNLDFKLFLAGKGMPEKYFKQAGKHLQVLGKVDNAIEFMANKQIMIVPRLSGGGMRVKIIEGLASGKTIISTSIGAEGIQCNPGTDILIADTPDDFAKALVKCLTDENFSKRIGENARLLAALKYDNKVTGAEVVSFYASILESADIKQRI